MEEKRIIEVNGVKLEVDLSQCRVVENYKIGSNVKVLIKDYESYKSFPGVIIGFDNFQKHPAILIAYLLTEYNSATIKIITFTGEDAGIEICLANTNELRFDKERVIELLDRSILQAEENVKDLKSKRQFFIKEFGAYFEK